MRIDENDEDEKIQCDVCLDLDHEKDNEIVICSLCNVAVHQNCYGSELIDRVPKGDWFCERCDSLKKNTELRCTDIKCFLCTDLKGAIKCIDKKENVWAHLICVNWTPEMYFKDE